jgi:hypothetical protein
MLDGASLAAAECWARPRWHRRLLWVLLVSLPASFAAIAPAQVRATSPPAHSHPNEFGTSWECDQGYRSDGGLCRRVVLPSHSYLAASGDTFECERGYRRDGERCSQISVPANAHLTDSRFVRGWECNQGYRERGGVCVAIRVPPHGFAPATAAIVP